MENKECHRYNHYKLAIPKIIGIVVVILWFSQVKYKGQGTFIICKTYN